MPANLSSFVKISADTISALHSAYYGLFGPQQRGVFETVARSFSESQTFDMANLVPVAAPEEIWRLEKGFNGECDVKLSDDEKLDVEKKLILVSRDFTTGCISYVCFVTAFGWALYVFLFLERNV